MTSPNPTPAQPPAPIITSSHLLLQPAGWLALLNALVALLVAFGLPLNHIQVAAITTIATGVLGIIVMFTTRPVVMSGLAAIVGTLLTAGAGFGLHLSADQIGAVVALVSLVVGFLTQQSVTPAPALRNRVQGRVVARG